MHVLPTEQYKANNPWFAVEKTLYDTTFLEKLQELLDSLQFLML